MGAKWREGKGIEVVSVVIGSSNASTIPRTTSGQN
jgi:hypothetical protein